MPGPDYDFASEFSDEDKAELAAREKAAARREAAYQGVKLPPKTEQEVDEERKIAFERQKLMTMSDGPQPAPVAPTTTAVSGVAALAFWHVRLTSGKSLVAPTWKGLKRRLVANEGSWEVHRFELPPTSENVCALFVPFVDADTTPWEMQEGWLKEKFQVLVQNGNVFRSDSE